MFDFLFCLDEFAHYYHGVYYTWYHELQNEYPKRHISAQSAVIALNNGNE